MDWTHLSHIVLSFFYFLASILRRLVLLTSDCIKRRNGANEPLLPSTVTTPRHSPTPSRETVVQLRRDIDISQARIGALTAQLDHVQQEARDTRAELDQTQARLRTVQGQVTRDAADFQKKLGDMEKERGITTALLDARTAELDAAEVFLVKADDFADSEILAIVEQLNGKIFQTSASIATSLRFSYMNANHHEVEDQLFSSLGRSAQLGEPLLSALRSVNHTEDPFLVQTALQACMSVYALWLANAWDLDSRDPHHLLHDIYSRMKEGGTYAPAFVPVP